ncbi:MAG: hypothetical protein WBA13_09140 [Microcoleaceae cyanobacterium]
MPDHNQRELVQQGDPKAIEAAINHSLKPRGITAEVMRDNGCLHVMMEGDQVPDNQSSLVTFVRNGMAKLNIESIYKLKVYGRQFGADLPTWEDEILLKSPPPGEMMIEQVVMPTDTESSSSVPLVDDEFEVDRQIEQEFAMGMQMPMSDEEMNLDDEEIDLNDDEEFDETHFNQEEEDYDDDELETSDTQSGNRSKIFLFILLALLLALAALAGLHLSGVYKLPFLGAGESPTEVDPQAIDGDPESIIDSDSGETPGSVPPPSPSDPWREAVNAAISAANLAGTAQTQAEWNAVANEWGRAVELMQQVPESSENYSTAQQKVVEYSNNQQIALQQAQNASN